MKTVLVTGGAGYIGTHILAVLASRGYRCVCVDNYSNSTPAALERVRRITGRPLEAFEADLRDQERLARAIAAGRIDSVIHLAGLKAVAESVEKPLLYYDNNVNGTIKLLEVLGAAGVRKFVFSSSATVYGAAERMPIGEDTPANPQSPYGRTKRMIEQMLEDLARSDASWKVMNLRYFNPVGAHESGLIGEAPSGVPSNLMPVVCRAAAGRTDKLRIFGGDYATKDGTGVRDYLHVMDLAEGHLAALEYLDKDPLPGPLPREGENVVTVNLGTGRGYTVLELVETFERVNGVRVPREIVGRRPGDVAVCYANPARGRKLLGWEAKRGLDEMCRDAWNWQSANSGGV